MFRYAEQRIIASFRIWLIRGSRGVEVELLIEPTPFNKGAGQEILIRNYGQIL